MIVEYIPDWAPIDNHKNYEHFSDYEPGNQPSVPIS